MLSQQQTLILRITIIMASSSSSFPSTSSSHNFADGVNYALSKLGMSHLELKNQQKQAIVAVYEGKDVFVFLPTGFGKSVCFQVLPFLFDHKLCLSDGSEKRCVIVVSPLVSLMVDQVRSLKSKGVYAVVISSSSRENTSWTGSFEPRRLACQALVSSSLLRRP